MNEIKLQSVKGYFNLMAVCSKCNKNATQVKISRYCLSALYHTPLLCDICYEDSN